MKTVNTHKKKFDRLAEILSDPVKIAEIQDIGGNGGGGEPVVPGVITTWLGRLKLLYGVPFNYLVPDVGMLPEESIRFFYVDGAWLDSLVEGAYSIGRSTAADLAHDSAFASHVHGRAADASKHERTRLTGGEHRDIAASSGGEASDTPVTPSEKVTGFLLRSAVVSGWPGLEVQAYTDTQQQDPAEILRMEHLAPDVLLCFFEGEIKELHIHEHPEALHFGVDQSDNPPYTYSKSLKYPVKSNSHEAGTQVDDAVAPPVQLASYFRDNDARVVQIDKLAGAIHSELSGKIDYTGPFTAAEFALEMIEGVEAVIFTFNPVKEGK
jgi:hypothetical protein